MTIAAQHIRAARLHLQKNDATLKTIIKQVGPCQIKLKRDRFLVLVRSIISQQISGAAANTIFQRLADGLGTSQITSSHLLTLDADEFRSLGISRQKSGYLLDLADKVETGQISLSTLGRKPDEDVVSELTKVKGIGRWTAQMFLMFSLGRLDIFPADDLGIRNAMAQAYAIETDDREQLHQIAANWSPYRTIACWYLWRFLDGPAAV